MTTDEDWSNFDFAEGYETDIDTMANILMDRRRVHSETKYLERILTFEAVSKAQNARELLLLVFDSFSIEENHRKTLTQLIIDFRGPQGKSK